VKTLEANEGIKPDAFVCMGEGGDVWCQSQKKLHAKYTPSCVDADGWTQFDPKPDVPFNCHQVTVADSKLGPANGFAILNGADGAGWGDSRELTTAERKILENMGITIPPDKEGKYHLQYGLGNDYVLQNQQDSWDTYRVAIGFFNATYDILSS